MTKESQKELIVLVGGGLVTVVLCWLLIMKPGLSKMESIKRTAHSLEEQATLMSEVYALQVSSKNTGEYFPTEADQRDLIAKISGFANKTGIHFESLTPITKVDEPYAKLILNIEAQAGFPILINFLENLEQLKPVVALTELSVSSGSGYRRRNSSEDTQQPRVKLSLETYLKK